MKKCHHGVVGMRRIHRITLLAALIGAVVGCDQGDLPDLAPVSGIVTLDGKPVANKNVFFAPDKGRGSQGITDEQGAYDLYYTAQVKGAIIGEHTVTISTPPPMDGNYKGHKETIPAKYNTKSELKKEVESGSNELNFELKSK
jgi:hypothetical protein